MNPARCLTPSSPRQQPDPPCGHGGKLALLRAPFLFHWGMCCVALIWRERFASLTLPPSPFMEFDMWTYRIMDDDDFVELKVAEKFRGRVLYVVMSGLGQPMRLATDRGIARWFCAMGSP